MPDGGIGVGRAPSTSILQPFTEADLNQSEAASMLLRKIGRKYTQQVFQTQVAPVYGQPLTVTVPLTPVGLVTKFIVEVATVIQTPDNGITLRRGLWGPWNQLSSLNYTDPANNARIAAPGWHVASVAAKRHRRVPGAAWTSDSPSRFGSVVQPIAAPSTIAPDDTQLVRCFYELPLSVGRNSLKGAVFTGAVFATQTLQLTINPLLVAPPATNANDCVYYQSGTDPDVPTMTTQITVWQEYWDDFPLSLLDPLSPDLSAVYEIKMTSINNLIANADNYIRFVNLRTFLSTMISFNNGGTNNPGTDINYFQLQSANQTTEWKRDVYLQSYLTRNMYGADWPDGNYMFDFTDAPIATAAEGNTVLAINPSSAASDAIVWVGWEDVAIGTVLAGAPSLIGQAGR